MNEIAAQWIIGIGLAFDLFGTIGLVRLPDVYNRVQAATKCVTLGTCMILLGVLVGAGGGAMGAKAMLCAVFLLLTSPVAAHAIARGAYRSGVRLWEGSVVDRYGEDLHAARPPAERRARSGRLTRRHRQGRGVRGMKKPKLRELGEAIKALVRGPATTKFPAEAYEAPEGFRGKPQYEEDDCIGCSACAEVCPSQCIEVTDDVTADPPMRRLDLHYEACIFCGQCALYCTTEKGVRMTTEYDLACFDRTQAVESVEKELVLCEVCGVVIGAREHLLWVAERLGAKRYANPTLILLADGELGLVSGQPARERDRPLDRSDTMRILCPKCRRATVLRETWGA